VQVAHVFGHERGEARAAQILDRVAENLPRGAVGEADRARGVDDDDGVRSVFGKHGEERVAFVARRFVKTLLIFVRHRCGGRETGLRF
jgi:hypothetical protein